ncbi:collagen alpha-2(I) chain-like [Antechinus flavipes]|uniref:collagen alpha-2(I) chain-like n=1 Tax=Antechinus flavipes TaxID=38775 RepID=UPI002235CC1A|nr:collagen alpha-2(I) chain-like [Antechinus flavipes]
MGTKDPLGLFLLSLGMGTERSTGASSLLSLGMGTKDPLVLFPSLPGDGDQGPTGAFPSLPGDGDQGPTGPLSFSPLGWGPRTHWGFSFSPWGWGLRDPLGPLPFSPWGWKIPRLETSRSRGEGLETHNGPDTRSHGGGNQKTRGRPWQPRSGSLLAWLTLSSRHLPGPRVTGYQSESSRGSKQVAQRGPALSKGRGTCKCPGTRGFQREDVPLAPGSYLRPHCVLSPATLTKCIHSSRVRLGLGSPVQTGIPQGDPNLKEPPDKGQAEPAGGHKALGLGNRGGHPETGSDLWPRGPAGASP